MKKTSRDENLARWLRKDQQATVSKYYGLAHNFKRNEGEAPGGESRSKVLLDDPENPEILKNLVRATPSRIAVGRSGTRYLTETYLAMRADHAIAKDAVYSEIHDDFATKLGCLPLHSRAEGREDYLLFPDKGRRLDKDSLSKLEQQGTRSMDVQVVVGDGLSAWAIERNAPEYLTSIVSELKAAGLSYGSPVFVRLARVGVQDHVGVTLGAKATIILVGERPGLGTGDSMSVYIAYGPKLDQDNAEKNCISNVRPMGILPPNAARLTVEILKKAFAAGRGGLAAQ